MKYRTLLFDIDNTILDFDANEAESFRNMTMDLGVPYTEELFQRYHMINKKIWEQNSDAGIRTEGRWRTVGTRISEISE